MTQLSKAIIADANIADETMSTATGGQGGITESEMDVDYDATFQSTDRDWLNTKKRCNAPALPINQTDPGCGAYLDAILNSEDADMHIARNGCVNFSR